MLQLKGSKCFVQFLASFLKCLGVCRLFHVMILVALQVSVQAKGPDLAKVLIVLSAGYIIFDDNTLLVFRNIPCNVHHLMKFVRQMVTPTFRV